MACYPRVVLLVAVAMGWAAGCHAIFGLTDYEVATPAGTGGIGGSGGGGGSYACTFPEDCPGADTDCRYRTCESHECGVENAPLDTLCDDDGGRVCDGQGTCVECNDPAQCQPGEICQSNECVTNECGNNIQDGDETDVDCGGRCAPCSNGEGCLTYEDCESQFCDTSGGAGGAGGAGGTAGAGGGTGGSAPVYGECAPCTGDPDCAGAPNTWCDPTVDGGSCVDQLADGFACDRPDQCLHGFCPAGSLVCCDAACDAACESCLGTETGSSNGTCATTTQCADCVSQYPAGGALFEVCDATATECLLRINSTVQTCNAFCTANGGECLSAANDNPDGSCGVGNAVSCSYGSFTSMLCYCSRGCGSGPPCVPPGVCNGGVCG